MCDLNLNESGEIEEEESQIRVDPEEEEDSLFELINKVEIRSFIYDCRDPKHSKRDVINDAWDAIASGLLFNREKVNGKFCRAKWKRLRDYYYKVKKSVKGKSGQGAKNKKPWKYYAAMDRVLSSYIEENEDTLSNFPGDDSDIQPETPDPESTSVPDETIIENNNNESTPTGRPTGANIKKRKLDAQEAMLNEKILRVLEEPEEVKDTFYHFGMQIASKLREAPSQTANYAMMKVTNLLYEIFDAPLYSSSFIINEGSVTTESTHTIQQL